MFGNKKAVLEMPADASVSADGGALEYAGFWARVAALVVDWAIVMTVSIVLLIVLGMAMGGTGLVIGNIICFFINLLYWPVMESSERQATFGKGLLGIQVTDLDGNRTSFVRSLLRNLAKILSSMILGIGFLLAAFTGRKQALHDMITSCLVVRAGPSNFLMAVVAAIAGLAIAIGASWYYVMNVYLPQTMGSAMKGADKDFQRDMEKAMKEAQRSAASKPPVAKAPEPAPAAKPSAPAPSVPPASVTVPAPVATAPEKPASVALAPATPAPVKPAAAPAMKAQAAPKPARAAAPPADGQPRAKRRAAAPRKPAGAPSETAMAPVQPPMTPKYNDVMTAVMNRDRAGAAEALDAGFRADRTDSNGVTPLMAAAMNGDIVMVQLLLKYGADPNRSGPAGSVLSYANRGGDGKLVELLRKAGAR